MKAFEAAGCEYTPSNDLFNIIWAKRATPQTLAALTPYQKVNHFPGTWGLGRKDSLAVNVGKMKRAFGEAPFDIVPVSFLLPNQKNELLRDAEQQPDTPENPLIYIMKPSASSCGRGIYLNRGIPAMPRGNKRMVCQRYIGNPLLIFGRKFDLRLYCCVTSFDPLRIYLFDEGLVRFAAEKYPGPDKDLDNIHMHLTNYSVNKTAELNRESRDRDYEGEDPVDIKWCVSDLKNYLKKNHPLKERAWEQIEAACNDVVIKAFLSIEHDVLERLRAECRDKSGRNCFELFGLDLMADDTLKVRLIEVNIMPSLATGTTLDKAVKARMLAHLLTLVRCIPCRRDEVRAAMLAPSEAAFCPAGSYTPIADRSYRFGTHPFSSARSVERPLLRRFNDAEDKDSLLTPAEALMLTEAEEELHCAGGFRRVFPHASTARQYLPFFTHGVSRNNYLSVSACLMRENADSDS
ncbi:tubulin tyrosine ligase [Strigomonas culicis]|nr:tubulin tyrosine ligase [Strigomonas culicis]|eukprot:EPY25887.1 tubulin tyrosine ligase [Strigomonas culicis]